MSFRLFIKKTAEKEIRNLPPKAQRQITGKISSLASCPRPQDAKRLKLRQREILRVDSGEYRILYSVEDGKQSVTISRVKHRKDVYRNL